MLRKLEPGAGEWVDPDDAPELDDAWFEGAVWEVNGAPVPTPPLRDADAATVKLTLEVDAEVARFFAVPEPGWETRMNLVLRGVAAEGRS
jgi:uncharacterized protein (DUF4415 family)